MSTKDNDRTASQTTRRARRTRAQLEMDIRAAVRSALEDRGYGALTFEDIAERAEVSKPVLYRRFRDRPSMVLDTLHAALQEELPSSPQSPAHSTGATDTADAATFDASLRGDLHQLFQDATSRAVTIGEDTYRGLVGEADPDALADIAGVSNAASDDMRTRVINPAVRRGELGPRHIPDAVLLAPYHLLRDAIVFSEPLPDIDHLVDDIAVPLYRTASTDSTLTE